MVAASRIVCALAALCGAARAAPASVTYDQRQHGEFNLQVEADGVAVVLLPGGSAADLFLDRKHYGVTGDRLQQIFGRHHGVGVSRKKKKKPEAQNCASTATQPEKPYTESPASPASSTTTRPPVETPEQYASEPPAPSVSPSEETAAAAETPKENAADVVAPEDVDVRLGADHRHYIRPGAPVEDPYSVTPDTPDIFPRPGTDGDRADDDEAVTTATDSAAETTAQAAADVAAVAAPETKPSSPVAAVQATGFDVSPASASPPGVETVDGPAVGADDGAGDAAAEAHAKPVADADAKPLTEDEPAAAAVKAEPSTDKTSAAEAAKKPANEQPAVEMVAMKTMEKPTVSEPLKVMQTTKNNKQPSPSADKPAEMVAMKTIEKPATSTAAADKSGIAADKSGIAAKPVAEAPAQGDAVKGGDGPAEPAASGSKPIEMVAVKTVDSPGATTTAKSVVSVRTVIRPAGSPKTAAAMSSNGTSIMRKVGDRKPLPSVTLEVSHPKVVV